MKAIFIILTTTFSALATEEQTHEQGSAKIANAQDELSADVQQLII